MYKRFSCLFVTTSFCSLFLISAFNFLVDPFSIYFESTFPRWNDNKAAEVDRLAIAIRMIEKKPKHLVLGSSRAKNLQPYVDKDIQDQSFYNASFLGADFNEIYAYFLHAIYVQPNLKTVVLGIDLFAFNPNRKPAVSFTEERLQKDSMTLQDIKNTLLSIQALTKACHTVFLSLFSVPHENVILQMGEEEYLKQMLSNEENYKNYTIDSKKIQKFKKLANLCKEKGIELKVLINPMRAMYWEFYVTNGLWPHVEALKEQLCAIHPIWDFSGFNPITTETLECGNNTLYHECSHFTSYTGSLLLQRMFEKPSLIDNVGYLLTPENKDEVFAEIHQQQLSWLSQRLTPHHREEAVLK